MKKSLIYIFILILSSSIFAQNNTFLKAIKKHYYAQHFGIRTGVNLSNTLFRNYYDTFSFDYKWKPGYNFGLSFEFPTKDIKLIGWLGWIETGVFLSSKGYRINEKNLDDVYKRRLNLTYLDIPLLAKVKFEVEASYIFLTFGPYLGIGLDGKYRYEEIKNGLSEKSSADIIWGNDGEIADFKKYDYGLIMGTGIEFEYFQIAFNYNLGTANISPNENIVNSSQAFNTRINNRVFNLSFTYKLGKRLRY
jgi:hypothetical protein